MRLATFNVLHGLSPEDERVDLDRFAAAVRDLDADVLALQEVDRGQPRSHGADLTQVAAQAMGAVAHRFAPALSGLPGAWGRAAGEADGMPQYGIALLSRLPVGDWQLVRLPALPGRVPVLFPGRRRPLLVHDEPRVALLGRVDAERGPVTVACTHLSFVPWWNGVQLLRVVRALGRRGPAVLMGDLNMDPARAVRLSGLRPLASGGTFPAEDPTEQLDHVLAADGVRARAPGGPRRLPLSDHRALQVEVDLP